MATCIEHGEWPLQYLACNKCFENGDPRKPLTRALPDKSQTDVLRIAREWLAGENARQCVRRAIANDIGPKTAAMIDEGVAMAEYIVAASSAVEQPGAVAAAGIKTSFDLTAQQVKQLYDFCYGGEAEDDAMPVTIGYLAKHEDGPGWYVWGTEYPEEGSLPLVTYLPSATEQPCRDTRLERIPCRCFDERSMALCLDKNRCSPPAEAFNG